MHIIFFIVLNNFLFLLAQFSSMSGHTLSSIFAAGNEIVSISSEGEVYYFKKGIHAKKLPLLNNVHSIAVCRNFILCLDNEGRVFSFGSGICSPKSFEGEYVKFSHPKNEPALVTGLPLIKNVSAGDSMALCISEDGDVFMVQELDYQILGDEDSLILKPPIQLEIDDLKNIDFIVCGKESFIFKSLNNHIFVMGENYKGQIGIGNTTADEPILCEDWPDNVVDIKCGAYHTLVLTSNLEVFSCGDNRKGQLGRELDVFESLSDNESYPETSEDDEVKED